MSAVSCVCITQTICRTRLLTLSPTDKYTIGPLRPAVVAPFLSHTDTPSICPSYPPLEPIERQLYVMPTIPEAPIQALQFTDDVEENSEQAVDIATVSEWSHDSTELVIGYASGKLVVWRKM